MSDAMRVGRINFGVGSMSELRRLVVQEPVESALVIKQLRDALLAAEGRAQGLQDAAHEWHSRAERAEEALRDIHEYHCGCKCPGDLSLCVAQPVVLFAALASGAGAAEETAEAPA